MARIKLLADISEQGSSELETLMKRLGLQDMKEVFNNALTLLKWATDEVDKGRDIASVSRTSDEIRPLEMEILEKLRSTPR